MPEITYWKSAKVPTVQYGSKDVCLTIKETVESGKEDETYERIKSFVDERVEAQANAIANDISGLRIREKNGKRYPSVTSILTPDKPNIQNLELYALRGTLYHQVCNEFLSGIPLSEISKRQNLPDISPLKYDLDIKGFFDKFGDKFGKHELNVELFHERLVYSGEADFIGIYDGKRTLGDFKTGSWKLSQLSAYARVITKIEQLAIFDLKNTKVHLFNLGGQEDVEAFEDFCLLRGAFKQRFNC